MRVLNDRREIAAAEGTVDEMIGGFERVFADEENDNDN